MKFNQLDKSGFTFAVSTLWGKVLDKFSSLSKVASSGKYIDLTGRPTKLSEFENDAGFKTTDTTYENMSGASASAVGKAGLVPAPGVGMQDAVLMGKGAWGKLGAAAFKGVANNDTTTEDGFLADARRVKALRDDVNKLNSALENLGLGYLFQRQIKTTPVTTQAGKWVTVTLRGFSVPEGYDIFSVYFQATVSAVSILLVDQDQSLVQFRIYADAQYNTTITVNRIFVKNNLIEDF